MNALTMRASVKSIPTRCNSNARRSTFSDSARAVVRSPHMSHDKLLELPHTEGCLVCGKKNAFGMKLNLFVDPSSGIVVVDFSPRPEHIGFTGVAHGGMLATVIDEAMVWAATWSMKRFCLCGELSV